MIASATPSSIASSSSASIDARRRPLSSSVTSSKVTTPTLRSAPSVNVVPEISTVRSPSGVSQSSWTLLSVSPRATRTSGIASPVIGNPAWS